MEKSNVISRMLSKTWNTVAALVAAVMAAWWLTPTVIESITTELIAFFAIQSAVILPAMIFTAGMLRGDGLTVDEITRFQAALRQQMYFWVTLLGLDVVAVTILIIGKASNWTWKVTIYHWSTNLGWTMLALATFITTVALLRMVPFVRGVMSLLDLNGWLAVKTVQARNLEEEKAAEERPSVTPFDVPKGYGRVLPQRRKH
jgi:hypothetical protein